MATRRVSFGNYAPSGRFNNKKIMENTKISNSSKEMDLIEDLLTIETRKLVGYVMPILEAERISIASKSNIKSILWNYKNNLKEKLIEQSHDKSNKN